MRIDAQHAFGRRECPSCATEVPVNNNHCPICGYEFPQATPTQKRMRLWGGLLMLGLFLVLAFGLTRCLPF